MPLLLWYGLPQRRMAINIMLATVFGALGLTDFLDGYLARRFSQETELGKMLDPIADKALVFATLISLMATGRVTALVGALIIGRELFVAGLRVCARTYHAKDIPVAGAGKVKTVFQFMYLGIVMLNNHDNLSAGAFMIEHFLLTGTVFFTLYSAVLYYQAYSAIPSIS